MNNLFLTGEIGIGKSTILKNALNELKELNLSIGGYTTRRVYEGYFRRFMVKPLYGDSEEYTIIRGDSRDRSKEIFIEAFQTNLISILDKSLRYSDLIVLDELGCAENDIDIFTSKVFELLDSSKIIFGVLKDADCTFLNNIRNRADVKVIRVNKNNRNYILKDVVEILRSFI